MKGNLESIKSHQGTIWVSEKFCNIFLFSSLRCLYYVTEAVQTVKGVPGVVGCILVGATLHVWFESRTDERATLSNL